MKKIFLVMVGLLLLLPSLSFAKPKMIKLYLSVGGDATYKTTFASEVRQGLRQYGDVEFVNDPTNALFVITLSISPLTTSGGRLTGFSVAMAINKLCENPDLSQLAGPDDLTEIIKMVVADINEDALEPLRGPRQEFGCNFPRAPGSSGLSLCLLS